MRRWWLWHKPQFHNKSSWLHSCFSCLPFFFPIIPNSAFYHLPILHCILAIIIISLYLSPSHPTPFPTSSCSSGTSHPNIPYLYLTDFAWSLPYALHLEQCLDIRASKVSINLRATPHRRPAGPIRRSSPQPWACLDTRCNIIYAKSQAAIMPLPASEGFVILTSLSAYIKMPHTDVYVPRKGNSKWWCTIWSCEHQVHDCEIAIM